MSTAALQQRSPAWHAARRGKLTASNIGSVLGLCPWTNRQTAYNRAMGLDKFLGQCLNAAIGHVPVSRLKVSPLLYAGNDATRWGTANESNGILAYTAHTGNVVDATGLHVDKTNAWIAGSPDGLIGTEGMLEVKCPFWRKKNGSRLHMQIPSYYYMQMNLCLEITEREWCDFITWAPEGYAIYRVTRDNNLHEAMMPHYLKFFAAIQRDAAKPPPQSAEEFGEIEAQVAASMSTHINYDFWRNVDVSARPPTPDDDGEEPSKKRSKPV